MICVAAVTLHPRRMCVAAASVLRRGGLGPRAGWDPLVSRLARGSEGSEVQRARGSGSKRARGGEFQGRGSEKGQQIRG